MDWLDITCTVLLSLNVLVLCPACIYHLIVYRRYEQQRDLYPIIKYRDSRLIYLLNALIIFSNLSERFYMSSSQIWNVIDVPECSVAMFLALAWWAVMTLFAIKCYHLYFIQQHNFAIADVSWRHDIDPDERNWYIANKSTFGNPVYLIWIAVIPYLVSVAIDVVVDALWPSSAAFDVINFILASIPIAIAIVIFYRARNVNDIYGVRNEIRYQFIILLSSLSLYTVSFVTCNYVVETTAFVTRIEWLTYHLVTDGVSVALAWFSTWYPIYLIRKSEKSAASSSLSREHSTSGHTSELNQLILVLADYNSFKVFMRYLVSAFCAESLLFLSELTQVKYHHQQQNNGVVRVPKDSLALVRQYQQQQYAKEMEPHKHEVAGSADISEKTNKSEMKDGHEARHEATNSDASMLSNNELSVTVDFNVTPHSYPGLSKDTIFTYFFDERGMITAPIYLPSSLPRTAALSQRNNTLYGHPLYSHMRFLYYKYIKEGSDFEINISWASRGALIDFFERNTPESEFKMFNLLDDAALEIFLLLQTAFTRFLHSPEYELLTRKEAPLFSTLSSSSLNASDKAVLRNASSYPMVKQNYAGFSV